MSMQLRSSFAIAEEEQQIGSARRIRPDWPEEYVLLICESTAKLMLTCLPQSKLSFAIESLI